MFVLLVAFVIWAIVNNRAGVYLALAGLGLPATSNTTSFGNRGLPVV